MPGGRPSKFKQEFVAQAQKLAALGATDREMADFFEVTEQTLNNWKLSHPEFFEALKQAKVTADDRVEQSLYRRALGYSFDSEKIFHFRGHITRAGCIEHVPPDVTACIFWLKNRRPDAWRANPDGEGGDGQPPEVTKALVDRLRA